jgi:hypothetical protein
MGRARAGASGRKTDGVCGTRIGDKTMRRSRLTRPYRRPFKKDGRIDYKMQPIDSLAARVTNWQKGTRPTRGYKFCPYCSAEVRKDRLERHIQRCHADAPKLPSESLSKPRTSAIGRRGRMGVIPIRTFVVRIVSVQSEATIWTSM